MRPCVDDSRCGNLCMHGKGDACSDYRAARAPGVFGLDVTVEFVDGRVEQFHWRGLSEGDARRRALLKRNAREVLNVEPLTEEQWIQVYGIGRM